MVVVFFQCVISLHIFSEYLLIKAFVRDPDGYYIEFCNCGPLEDYLKEKTEEAAQLINNIKSLSTMKTMGERFKKFSASARANSRDNSRERNLNSFEKDQVMNYSQF